MEDRILGPLRAHFASIEQRIASGEARLGYKVAFNIAAAQRQLGIDHSLIAGLTERTLLREEKPIVDVSAMTRPLLEAEVAVRLRATVRPDATADEVIDAIDGIAPAIELIDLDLPMDRLEEILSAGVFHRAVAFGRFSPPPRGAALAGLGVRVTSSGEPVFEGDAERATGGLVDLLPRLAGLAECADQRLLAGDRIILGSMAPPHPARPGRAFALEIAGYGRVELGFRSSAPAPS